MSPYDVKGMREKLYEHFLIGMRAMVIHYIQKMKGG